MDKFVKGENEMWKMPAKERIQTIIVAASAEKRVLDFRHQLSVCPPATHLKMFRQKEAPIDYYAAIILNYRNVAKHLWREPQIIKFENAFHIWINIGYICERTLPALSCIKSRFRAHRWHILQTATYNRNFMVLLLLLSRISQNWSAPDSIRCFINGE